MEKIIILICYLENKKLEVIKEHIFTQLDYIIVATKNKNILEPFMFLLKIKNSKSLYQSSLDPLRGCNNQRYWIKCPDGSFIIPPGKNFQN